jgi:alpha-L-fucosidase
MSWKSTRVFLTAVIFILFPLAAVLGDGKNQGPTDARFWWQKPGLGIQYQIEQRPGWNWERDFEKFNKSMSDEQGNLKFNGPFCKTADWVELSRRVGVDFHVMESKWHDGICYFDTKLTSWKTPVDYIGQFSEASRRAGIPYMFYYSTIFDHNPMFDKLQPLKHHTFSMLGLVPGRTYEDYLCGQFKELVEQYAPDGLWLDWYSPWPDRSSSESLKFLRRNYPKVVVTFNNSNTFPQTYSKLNYTSSEAHDLRGSKDRSPGLPGLVTAMNSYCWRDANRFRAGFSHPWELISPCGKDWQVVSLREDTNELLRMTASTLACGGKHLIGAATGLDGAVLPEHVRQLLLLGQWYRPRHEFFVNAEPIAYAGDCPPGVSGFSKKDFGVVASRLGEDRLLHLINFSGKSAQIQLRLDGGEWGGWHKAYLEPGHRELALEKSGDSLLIPLCPCILDPVDTIIRLTINVKE